MARRSESTTLPAEATYEDRQQAVHALAREIYILRVCNGPGAFDLAHHRAEATKAAEAFYPEEV